MKPSATKTDAVRSITRLIEAVETTQQAAAVP